MRGTSCFLPGHRFERRASTPSIKNGLKLSKLPKYEGKCLFRAQLVNPCAMELTTRSSFRFTGVRALLILGNQIFLRHVHILFTRPFLSSPGAGLRVEIAHNIDKKKSELYFYLSVKKFLTEKAIRACAETGKFVIVLLISRLRAAVFSLLQRTANVLAAS